MENMLPESSFPQICVVSEIESLRSAEIRQEYEGSVVFFPTARLFPGIRGRYEP